MTWNTYHRRGETLRDVIALVDERRDGALPWQAPGVAENFTDDLDLLGALLLKWHARLSGNLERALARQPMDLAAAVVDAWRTTAEQMPGTRLVVDRAAQHGDVETQRVLARAQERECARLALAAGLASTPGPAAVTAGQQLEQQARAALPPLTHTTPKEDLVFEKKPAENQERTTESATDQTPEEANASFVDRIKAALAAA